MCQTLDNTPGFRWGFLVLCKTARYVQMWLLNLLILVWWWYTFPLPCVSFLTLVSSKFDSYLQYWTVTTLELGVGMSASHCFLDSLWQALVWFRARVSMVLLYAL